jgi:hypothetical protein
MESELLVRPGRLWAILVSGGRFWRRKSTAWVDCIRSLLGWMTVMYDLFVATDIVVAGITSNFEVVESRNAVDAKSGGLA